MSIRDDLRYTEEHEWVKVDGDVATIGITAHAQDQLGDVVFVELPQVGEQFSAGQGFGTVESVKAVSDLFCPLAGEITEVNESLADAPDLVNSSPYDEAWMVRIKLKDSQSVAELMDAQSYREFLNS